ncbi:MAG: hypothetical protein ACOCWI_01865 [Bacillota bacterium]
MGNDKFGLSMAIADNSYMRLASAQVESNTVEFQDIVGLPKKYAIGGRNFYY